MILGGNRKSESLGLKLNNFHLVGADSVGKFYQMEKERHDDFPHKVRPSIKTNARPVALSPLMASIFEYYITKVRTKAKNHHKSQYMFLSLRSGQPIGLSTPNDSIAALIEKHPEFKGKLTPHILRNTYFDALRDNIDNKSESERIADKEGNMKRLMEFAGGWASGSKMPDRYSLGSIQRKVAEFNIQIQTRILGDS
jgi:integrase